MSDVSIAGSGLTTRRRNIAGTAAAARWGFILLLPLLIVAMELGVSLIEPRVLSLRNVINILVQSSYLLLFASAQMVVILTGGFDLSLGMAVSVISVATALVTTALAAAGMPAWLDCGRRNRNRSRRRAIDRHFQRDIRFLDRHQPVRCNARQPEHLLWAGDDDLGRPAGFRRARCLHPRSV